MSFAQTMFYFFGILLLDIYVHRTHVLCDENNVKHALSCENEKMKLNCPNGQVINVLDGNYGRTSSSACKKEPIRSVTCYQNNTASIVTDLCEGLSECTVDANNKVFGDPCEGTVKYLFVLYHCVSEKEFKQSLGCENRPLLLECDPGRVIQIHGANYGRRTQVICTEGPISSTNCFIDYAVDIVSRLCNNKRTCTVMATNNVFGDPCFGTHKYLSVQYKCVPVPDAKHALSCENEKMKLNCPNGKIINILDGNYGRTSASACMIEPIRSVTCYQNNTVSIVTHLCEGRSECTVDANNKVFGDPCAGTVKYLLVLYHCVSEKGITMDDYCPVIEIENGQYGVLGQGYRTKTPIPNYALVKLSCNANYTLYPATPLIACNNGSWNMPIPQCRLTCPPRVSSSMNVNCTVDGIAVDCSQPLVEGTVARSSCKRFYAQSDYDIPISTCIRGSWSNPPVRCVPECGEVVSIGGTNIVNGTYVKKGEFPWHIGLYRLHEEKHEYQCGGTIINPQIIIAAAHCFTDESGLRYPQEEFYVAAGKYYSDYNSVEDIYAQKRQVKEYYIPSKYQGYAGNFAGDLAVVIVRTIFELSNVVQPVCMDWDDKIGNQQLKHNNRGSVVGWGFVDPNIPKASKELKQLNPLYIDLGQCLDEVPSNFRRWVTLDKFCAGFRNGSSLCKGDSGGGLVFKWNNKEKFYLRGVVKEYYIPSKYQGYAGNFAGDLAVVIVRTIFELSNVVQPVCMDWDDKIGNQQLKHNNRGSVVGWGFVDPNIPKASKELKQLNPLYIDLGQCLDEVPSNFRRWVTLDKFCAGFRNGSSLCKGDSGGGLVFKWNNKEKFYLRGVVSVGPIRNGVCDNFQYGVYTKVSYYSEFILNIININTINNN